MDIKKRIIWVCLFIGSLIVTIYYRVFPWVLFINAIPVFYGIYLFINFGEDLKPNKPWRIAQFIFFMICASFLSKTIDRGAELANIDFYKVFLLKISLVVSVAAVVKKNSGKTKSQKIY